MDDVPENRRLFSRPSPEFIFFLLVFGWPGPLLIAYALQERNLLLCGIGWILTAWPWDAHGLPLLRAHWPALDTRLRSLRRRLSARVDDRLGLSWLRHITPAKRLVATGLACTALLLLDDLPRYERVLSLLVLWLALWEIHSIRISRVWMLSSMLRVDERAGRDLTDGVVFARHTLLTLSYVAVIHAAGGSTLRALLDSWR